MSSCEGKTALVTEGSGGIGRATAIALAKAGAQVLVHYHRGASKADQVVSEIRSFGGRADTIGAAIASADGPHDLARRTRAIMGDRLDILVLNCTALEETPLATVTVENFDSQFANNVRAPLFLIQQLLPILGTGSSVVFTLASSSKERDAPAYITTRGAIAALVPHLASALAARGIRVNALAHARSDVQDVALAITSSLRTKRRRYPATRSAATSRRSTEQATGDRACWGSRSEFPIPPIPSPSSPTRNASW